MAKKGLGKGIENLIPNRLLEKDNKKIEKVENIVSIDKIIVNENQPRKYFDEKALLDLSNSIKNYGIISPIIVRKLEDKYLIIAGERRYRAAKLAGLKEVPVIIRELTDEELIEISIIENIQRQNLNPVELAMAYKTLIDNYNFTHEKLSERLSISRSNITNILRINSLTNFVKEMIINEKITSGHARALAVIKDEKLQKDITEYIIAKNFNVRQTEEYIKKILDNIKDTKKTKKELPIEIKEYSKKLEEYFSTKVTIKNKKNNSGKIEISYYDLEDFDRILNALLE